MTTPTLREQCLIPVADLVPYARNARTHSPAQVAQLAASIREFGWTNPVLIDEAGGIIAGHGRVLAAREMGMQAVPCLRLTGLTEAQKRAYVIADNKLALNAGWDEALLEAEIEALADMGFDIALTGFDELLEEAGRERAESEVRLVQTSQVADRFWISVRGPLAKQAQALRRLLEVMQEIGGIDVALGTIDDA